MNDDGDGDGLAYDSESSSVIKLNNGMVLYLREVNKCVRRVVCESVRKSASLEEHSRSYCAATSPLCVCCARRTF